jgi:cardiolipin synthase
MKLTLPNAISLLRVPLAAGFVAAGGVIERGIILTFAAASDYFDGWTARHLNQRSRTGELLDPITDKIFAFVTITTFYVRGAVSGPELAIVLARDFYTSLAFLIAAVFRLPIRFRARVTGKVVTALQIALVTSLVFLPSLKTPLIGLTAAAAFVAIGDYTLAAINSLRRRSPAE